ncbi:MAG: abortive phage infection protein, partial [Peptococcaceae bacterium BICA1-8]
MISLNEFHQDFLQSILSDAESRGLMKPQAFFENVCEELVSTGDLTNNYTAAEYIKTGMEVYGYDYDQERKILSILVHQFFQEDEIETLTKSHITTKFNRLKTFYKKCTQGLYSNMEETSEAYSMAYNIYRYKQDNQI